MNFYIEPLHVYDDVAWNNQLHRYTVNWEGGAGDRYHVWIKFDHKGDFIIDSHMHVVRSVVAWQGPTTKHSKRSLSSHDRTRRLIYAYVNADRIKAAFDAEVARAATLIADAAVMRAGNVRQTLITHAARVGISDSAFQVVGSTHDLNDDDLLALVDALALH